MCNKNTTTGQCELTKPDAIGMPFHHALSYRLGQWCGKFGLNLNEVASYLLNTKSIKNQSNYHNVKI